MKCTECPEYRECVKNHNLTIKRKKCPKAKQEIKLTNADRIRAMTDEELAAVLGGMCVGILVCEGCFAIDNCPEDKGVTWEEWLQQPAEEKE